MAYLFFEILGSLVIVAVAAFALGWFLRGLREKARSRFDLDPDSDPASELDPDSDPASELDPGSDSNPGLDPDQG